MASAPLRWSFPWPKGLGVNHLYRPRWRNQPGRTLTEGARAYRDQVVFVVRATAPELPPGDLRLVLTAYEPDRRRRDTDGLVKFVQDCVFYALGTDDTRVRKLEAERISPGEGEARIEVELSEYKREAAA